MARTMLGEYKTPE
jgi:hypothetical protein